MGNAPVNGAAKPKVIRVSSQVSFSNHSADKSGLSFGSSYENDDQYQRNSGNSNNPVPSWLFAEETDERASTASRITSELRNLTKTITDSVASFAPDPSFGHRQKVKMSTKLMLPVYFTPLPIEEADIMFAKHTWSLVHKNTLPQFLALTTKEEAWPYKSTFNWFTRTFFDRLFDVHPMARTSFRSCHDREQFVEHMFTFLMSKDISEQPFVRRVQKLAKFHCSRLDIKAIEFSVMGEVAFWTFRTILGEGIYDHATHLAWRKIFSRLLSIMVPVAVDFELRQQRLQPVTAGQAVVHKPHVHTFSYRKPAKQFVMKSMSDKEPAQIPQKAVERAERIRQARALGKLIVDEFSETSSGEGAEQFTTTTATATTATAATTTTTTAASTAIAPAPANLYASPLRARHASSQKETKRIQKHANVSSEGKSLDRSSLEFRAHAMYFRLNEKDAIKEQDAEYDGSCDSSEQQAQATTTERQRRKSQSRSSNSGPIAAIHPPAYEAKHNSNRHDYQQLFSTAANNNSWFSNWGSNSNSNSNSNSVNKSVNNKSVSNSGSNSNNNTINHSNCRDDTKSQQISPDCGPKLSSSIPPNATNALSVAPAALVSPIAGKKSRGDTFSSNYNNNSYNTKNNSSIDSSNDEYEGYGHEDRSKQDMSRYHHYGSGYVLSETDFEDIYHDQQQQKTRCSTQTTATTASTTKSTTQSNSNAATGVIEI